MLSKNTLKHLKKLEKKKYREEFQECKIEGEKTVLEFLHSNISVKIVFATEPYYKKYKNQFSKVVFELADEGEIQKSSFYETNTSMLAIADISQRKTVKNSDFIVVLDNISDPGNLGTIIRICDWYGISEIVCSENTVDCYNPKVVASTKGSLARVSISYQNLGTFLEKNATHKIYGALLEGENLHQKTNFSEKKILIIGNESHGISENLKKYISEKVTIPCFGKAESLNAGVAAGIIIDRMKSI